VHGIIDVALYRVYGKFSRFYGKLRFQLVGRLEKRVNCEGSILIQSVIAHYPGFQITCYAAYFASRPRYLTNYMTARNPHNVIQQPRFGWLIMTSV
jgi:hypothetical protein